MQGGLRGLADEILQPLARRPQPLEEETVRGGIAAHQLGGMQIPALVEAVDQRMAQVVGVQPPGRMDRALVLALLFFAEVVALVGRDRHEGGRAVGEEDAGAGVRHLHHLLGEVAGRVAHVLVERGDVAARRVIVGAEVRRHHPAAGGPEELRKHRDAIGVEKGLRHFDHRIPMDLRAKRA